MSEQWTVFRADGSTPAPVGRLNLPPPPPWRTFAESDQRTGADRIHWVPTGEAVSRVNAALWLRRPLLVTGSPGTGKSTLAEAIATELGLGDVLVWNINSRTTAQDGLYRYDAIGRLHDRSLHRGFGRRRDIGPYLRLGPLGTALLPGDRPRVLLIDEIDKADIDLPDDLLNLFEAGSYEIPELVRIAAKQRTVRVLTAADGTATIVDGRVQCTEYPLTILTSNGDREFSPAFVRRCVRLHLPAPGRTELVAIVQSWLPEHLDQEVLRRFLDARASGMLATDQLLNALYLRLNDVEASLWSLADLESAVLQALDRMGAEADR
jgi:MoxR-like ATPase